VSKTDQNGNPIKVGMAKLVSPLSKEPQTYIKKSTGEEKSYFLATAQVVTPSGKTTTITVSVPQANIDRLAENNAEFTVGNDYLTTLSRVERNDGNGMITFARMSHLQNAVNDEAILDEFFGDEEVVATNNESVEATA